MLNAPAPTPTSGTTDESPSSMSVPAVAAATDASTTPPSAQDRPRLHVVPEPPPRPGRGPEPEAGDPPPPQLPRGALRVVDDDDPVPSPRTEAAPPGAAAAPLPDARTAAEGLARCVLEILAGARDLEQVSRWVNGEVYAGLQARVRIAVRAREASGTRPQRPVFRVGRVHVSVPASGVAETVVVVHGRARTRSVAIRLEATGRRWRATALHVL